MKTGMIFRKIFLWDAFISLVASMEQCKHVIDKDAQSDFFVHNDGLDLSHVQAY